MILSSLLGAALLVAGFSGCGGGSSSSSTAAVVTTAAVDTNSQELNRAVRRLQVARAVQALARYCVDIGNGGVGNATAAINARDRLIAIARKNPEFRDIDGKTMRQVLSDEASSMEACGVPAPLTDSLDRALQTL